MLDAYRAKALEQELRATGVAGWQVDSLIDCGKSAAVFKAKKNKTTAALKIFDRELVARFGAQVQAARIQRELELVSKPHPNVVTIYDGGYDAGPGLHYVAMEYLPAPNLSTTVANFEPRLIPPLVQQLASAAQHLESLNLAHRDIKPSNIIWFEDQTLKLLDLGVLVLVGEAGAITDTAAREFVGTLQYSSPEYLLRQEEDSADGWRAVTFYQIGAVMHDLIMGKPLFQEFSSPYGRLVNAVQFERPLIQSAAIPQRIVDLARRCLVKDPQLRLSLVKWSHFDDLQKEARSSAKERVTNRLIMSAVSASGEVAPMDKARKRAEVEAQLASVLPGYIRAIRSDSTVFPPITVVRKASQMTVKFAKSERHGLPSGLVIVISWNVIDAAEKVVELTGKADQPGLPQHETIFFKGIVDTAAIYSAMEELVYALLDSSQQETLATRAEEER